LSDIGWGDGGVGHDEAVAVLRVWLVSSVSEGLQENPYFLLLLVVLEKTVHVSPFCRQYRKIKEQRRLFDVRRLLLSKS
jgi:hypothetical protein